ncbi:hypothetical protein OJF2_14080 [Aquisphaera giovannonii]|uniref:Uncharacterized protein n=1 Tax=Aquisphaera giovannonii TaxID=406548 RepID=A0A5B9VX63_9BACT|nr:hypothetical protein OJF2_14080 [Aquisphaera giovannonii]
MPRKLTHPPKSHLDHASLPDASRMLDVPGSVIMAALDSGRFLTPRLWTNKGPVWIRADLADWVAAGSFPR